MPKTTKPTGDGKRYPLNMRTTREVRERLEATAAANGRSLAQEVETRLERSFYVDLSELMDAAAASRKILAGLAELNSLSTDLLDLGRELQPQHRDTVHVIVSNLLHAHRTIYGGVQALYPDQEQDK